MKQMVNTSNDAVLSIRPAAPRSNEVHVTEAVYERMATKLREMIDETCSDYLMDADVEVDTGACLYVLVGSFLIYRTTEAVPEGESCSIKDIVPVWYEFQSYVSFHLTDGEPLTAVPNDGRFDKIRQLIRK